MTKHRWHSKVMKKFSVEIKNLKSPREQNRSQDIFDIFLRLYLSYVNFHLME